MAGMPLILKLVLTAVFAGTSRYCLGRCVGTSDGTPDRTTRVNYGAHLAMGIAMTVMARRRAASRALAGRVLRRCLRMVRRSDNRYQDGRGIELDRRRRGIGDTDPGRPPQRRGTTVLRPSRSRHGCHGMDAHDQWTP